MFITGSATGSTKVAGLALTPNGLNASNAYPFLIDLCSDGLMTVKTKLEIHVYYCIQSIKCDIRYLV